MVENTLQQLIYGQAWIDDVLSHNSEILGMSGQLNHDDAVALYQRIPLDPMSVDGIHASQAVALVALKNGDDEEHYILARSHYQNDEQALPVHHYIFLPNQALLHLGDIAPLLKLFDKPIPLYSDINIALEPLNLPLPVTWTMDKGVALLKTLLDGIAEGDIRRLLLILGAALDKGAVIYNFEADTEARLQLIRGLLLLLPAPARPYLTFTTHTTTLNGTLPRIVFSDAEIVDGYWHIDWQNPVFRDDLFFHPYIAHLFRIWDDDMIALAETVRNLDLLASFLMRDQALDIGLSAIVQRHRVDLAVLNGEDVETEALIEVLQSDMPLSSDLRLPYLRLLLQKNFETREPQEAKIIVQYLEEYPELDSQLKHEFDEALDTQPDALYAFVRVRVRLANEDDTEIDEKWLKRLHYAAENSLQIAIQSGDTQTILSWLTLLSREPANYELGDTLHNGIISAKSYATEDSEFGQGLLTLAVKRQADALANLLEDTDLLFALPDSIQAALCNFDSAAIDSLADESRELFLLTLERAIEQKQHCISSTAIRDLWQIHTQKKMNTLAPQFRPYLIIQELIINHEIFLDGALANLITLMLIDDEELFFEIVPSLAESDILAGVLVEALEQSGRSVEGVLAIVNALHSNQWLLPQQTVDTYTFLLVDRNWDPESLPLVEQLARILNQHPDTDTTSGILWKLAELSSELKIEPMLRVSTRRLLNDIGTMITEIQIVDSMLRLRKAAQWSNNGRKVIVRWWRAYTREQNLAQLQKLAKVLDGKRNNDDLRSIIQTTIALRRVIGTETLSEFAEAISKTRHILQALSEGFDSSDKLIDSATIRDEIAARTEEIPADVRHVLATNLKELAQLVTTLSDKRSKASLIRSGESVERQLVKGEQQPQSAIDVMRWLSGYLDGVQKDDEAEG